MGVARSHSEGPPRRHVSARAVALKQPGWRATEAQLMDLTIRDLDVLKVYGMPIRPLPEHVVEAARRAAGELLLPPPSRGSTELREAIAGKLNVEHGFEVDPATQIVVTNGAMQAVNIVCRSVLDPGDEVIIPSPTFFFYGIIELVGGTPVYVASDESAEWEWDLDGIERAITDRTKLFILCSPVNPTGFVVPERVIRRIFELAEQRDFLVLADESYDRMVYDGKTFTSAARLSGVRDRLILVQSITKSYAMAAWRIGYVVAEPSLTDVFAKILEWEILYGNEICQRAAAAAITGPQEWLMDIPDEFQSYRDAIWPSIAAVPGVRCVKPSATPYLFLDVSGLGVGGNEFADVLVQQFGVPATGGGHFASPDHVRVGFGAPDARTREELCRRIQAAASPFLSG
jgi:aspartate/methionine/tyrosine aminotransferase